MSISSTMLIFANYMRSIFKVVGSIGNFGIRLSSSPGRWRGRIEFVKILFFNFSNGVHAYASGDPRAVGGAERQQWYLARSLALAGWEVIVGVLGESNAAGGDIIDNVRFVRLPAYRGLLAPLKRIVALYRLLRCEAPDWLYWRCASYLFGPVVAIAKLANVKIVFAAAFDTDVQPRRALTERRAMWPLYAWGLSRCERIFVQHNGQLHALPAKLQSKAAIVRSIIDLPQDVNRHVERDPMWLGSVCYDNRNAQICCWRSQRERNICDLRYAAELRTTVLRKATVLWLPSAWPSFPTSNILGRSRRAQRPK